MKISNSKKQLAEIIHENGGWSGDAGWAVQHANDRVVATAPHDRPEFGVGTRWWNAGWFYAGFDAKLQPNGHQTILSRDEYFHLYPAPDADGWIEWSGGECPVEEETVVGVKQCDGHTYMAEAKNFHWRLTSGRKCVAAYRLHKPEQSTVESRLADAVDIVKSAAPALMRDEMKFTGDEVMGERKPTIEQLAADYHSAKDYADRKQQEAEAAKADAEAKLAELAELVAAGKAIGLVLGVAQARKYHGEFYNAELGERPSYGAGTREAVCDGCGKRYSSHFGYNCKPGAQDA